MARRIRFLPAYVAGIVALAGCTLFAKGIPPVITPEGASGTPPPVPAQEGPKMRFFPETRTLAVSGKTDNGAVANYLYYEGLAPDPVACAGEIVELNAARLAAADRMRRDEYYSWRWEIKNTVLELGPACTAGLER